MSAELSYEFAFGTYEEGLKMVGYRSEPRVAATAVSGARIQMFAATVRDPNPGYWDVEFATETWGGLIAPPAMLMGWLIPPPWQPTGRPPVPSLAIRIPLPGTSFVNASNEVEFLDPILRGRPADRRGGGRVHLPGEAHSTGHRSLRADAGNLLP